MQSAKCDECGISGALGSFKIVNERLCCERCAQKLVQQAGSKPPEVIAVIDATVCFQCKADNGSQELPLVGNFPFCSRCAAALYARPFPGWLKVSLAGLLALLVGALIHGARYFAAGRALVAGERLVALRHYEEAIPRLKAVQVVAPGCEKAILLRAKAELLSGRFEDAQKTVNSHTGGQFKEGPLTQEVRQIFDRVSKATEKFSKAQKLYADKKWEEAARAMREVATSLPEAPVLATNADVLEGVAAFERKDYDRFLEIAEKSWREHPDSSDAARMLASALACKFAVTGEPSVRQRSEEMLVKARELTASSPEAKEQQRLFEERTRYRLRTREIIEPEEYDRRFHPKKTER